jgi:GxxExxY protein
VTYRGKQLDAGYRLDLLVADRLIVELKTVPELLPIHRAQLLTYLRLSGCRIGFLINFNAVPFKDGIKRLIVAPSTTP